MAITSTARTKLTAQRERARQRQVYWQLRKYGRRLRICRHYIPTGLVALGVTEGAILFGSMYLGVAVYAVANNLEPKSAVLGFSIFPKAMVLTVVMLAILVAFGFYNRDTQQPDWKYWIWLVNSFVVGGVCAMSFALLSSSPSLPLEPGLLGLIVLFAYLGSATARYVFFKFTAQESLNRRALVLGTGSTAASLSMLEQANDGDRRSSIVGYLSLNETRYALDELRSPSGGKSILDIARKYRANEIIVGMRDKRNGKLPIKDLLDCRMHGISIIDLPTFFERETGRVQLDSLNPSWFVFSDGCRRGSLKMVEKRLLDICVASILLFLTIPVMAVTAILIWLESGRPISYRQERIGKKGQSFEILKFRSMYQGAESDSRPQWSKKGDARITRVGKIIRKFRIDELPQLINVLRGEMSFVGPRPERPFFVDDLSSKIPYYAYRHSVKPGLTGWAQIRYPYGASLNDAINKLQYDLYYVKNQSVFLDLLILVQTFHVILFAKGGR